MVAAARQNPFKTAENRDHSAFGPGATEAHRRGTAPGAKARSAVVSLVMTAVWMGLTVFCFALWVRQAEHDFPLMGTLAAVIAWFHLAQLPERLRGLRDDMQTKRSR
jgi:hypothetical protein